MSLDDELIAKLRALGVTVHAPGKVKGAAVAMDPHPEGCWVHIHDLRSLLAERAWKPIETAPRDGTHVLAWAPKRGEVCIVFYGAGNWWADDSCPDVTHWQPLPEAPI